MKIIADLHLHSRFSRATSPKITLPYLDFWARQKGVSVLGTGDFTHPQWLSEIKKELKESEEGLYKLKNE